MRRKKALEFRPLRGRCRSETGAPLPCALRAGYRNAVSWPSRAAKPARRHSRTSHPAHHHNAAPTPVARGSGAPVSDRHRGRRPRNSRRRSAPSREPDTKTTKRPTRAVVAAPFPLVRASCGERKPWSFARCAGDAGRRPASRPQAAKLPAPWRPVAGTRNEGDEATYARAVVVAPFPLARASCRERKPWSFARCAGDAGRRPALHCRARFGRVAGTRSRGPRGPRNWRVTIHARHTPPSTTTLPPHQSRAAAERRSLTGIAAAGRETRTRPGRRTRPGPSAM